MTEEEVEAAMSELSINLSDIEDQHRQNTEIENLTDEDIDLLLESINSKEEVPEENLDETKENTEASTEETKEEESNKEILLGILGEICKDEAFRGLIDTDEDGNINKEELLTLIDTIKAFDTDEANLTLADLI